MPTKITRKYAPPAEPKNWGRIAGGVLFGLALIALPYLRAGSAIDNALVYTFGLGQTYDVRGPRPSLSGYTAKDIAIKFDDGEVKIKQLDVNIGFWGMLKNSFSKRMNSPVDQVSFVYRDIENPEGYDLFDPFGVVGPESTSIFEAYGCGEHGYWTNEELRTQLKLPAQPTTMTVLFDTDGDRVTRTTSFEAPGSGSMSLSLTAMGKPSERTMFAIPYPGKLTSLKISIKDGGFIKARNAFCAQLTGVSEAQFVDNHVASIQRDLLVMGVEMSPQMASVYREFAASGGELNLDLTLRTSLGGTPESYGDFFRVFEGEIRAGAKREAYSLNTAPAADYPDGMEERTAYEVLLAEKGLPSQQGTGATNAPGVGNASGSTEVVEMQVKPSLSSQVIAVERLDREYLNSVSAVLAYPGRKMRIERNGKAPLIAQFLRASKTGLLLRVQKAGGFVEMEMPRSEFKRALLFANR